MAQEPSDSSPETLDNESQAPDPSLSRQISSSRLNAKAPEFVPNPRVVIPPPGLVHHVYTPAPNSPFHVPIHHPYTHHVPIQFHHNHSHSHNQQHHNHNSSSNNHHQHHRQFYGGDQQESGGQQSTVELDHASSARNGLTEEASQKIVNQVEYYFSDVNLATTDHLMRFINKDREGYVPISVVASFKKIKALINSNSQLASILRNSAKLVVSEDGKKVRRQLPLTEPDMEELQSRIVIAENLPEDHCHQNLMKIFSAVGSVKTIRTCQPQSSSGGASSASRTAKADGMLYSNKLHAFVEYESVELAEKAVVELNEEGNWRNGLRVRLLLRRTPKSAQGRVKKVGHEGEGQQNKEDDTSTSDQQDPNEKHLDDCSQPPSQQSDAQSHDHAGEEQPNGKEGGQKKGRNRGRGKGRGRPQYHHNHRGSHHVGTPPSALNINAANTEQPAVGKQPPGPRMPDGTRGFSLGRGKPIADNTA